MPSLHFLLLLLILSLMAPSLSSASQPDSDDIPTIPASPSFSTNSPLSMSPFQELSPDIAPLLPSPGGKVPPGSDFPTIPSSPSPPNPDGAVAPGPDSALAPFGSLPVSSADPKSSFRLFNSVPFMAVLATAAAYGALNLF